jgi:hypothetical protein
MFLMLGLCTDLLVQDLFNCEPRLIAWLNESPFNAELFRRDPRTAIRAANLGVDEELLCDLEEIVAGIGVERVHALQ